MLLELQSYEQTPELQIQVWALGLVLASAERNLPTWNETWGQILREPADANGNRPDLVAVEVLSLGLKDALLHKFPPEEAAAMVQSKLDEMG